ncbi:MAG: hypothetical protein ACK5ME_03080 [Parahaliea sp.]
MDALPQTRTRSGGNHCRRHYRSVVTQKTDEPIKEQSGQVLFFPYADDFTYVHRVGGRSDSPFVNIGFDFLAPLDDACPAGLAQWEGPDITIIKSNRRGRSCRLVLSVDSAVNIPEGGSALLLVPLTPLSLRIDALLWAAKPGAFRVYEGERPMQMHNEGNQAAQLIVFDAC